MAKRPINVRLDDDLIAAVDALAAQMGTDRTDLIARGLRRELLYDGNREFIYVLLDEGGEVRYVGRSRDPYKRLREHIARAPANGTTKEAWLARLLAEGHTPGMRIIDDGEASEIAALEASWVAHFSVGRRLTNGKPKPPTKCVRLPVALLEPLKAEAKREGVPLADVLAARLAGFPVVTDGRMPRGSLAVVSEQDAVYVPPGTAAQGRQPKAAAPSARPPLAAARPNVGPRVHLPRCPCAVCKPPPKGKG